MMEEIEALERLRAQQGLCAHGYSLGCPFGCQHKSELAALRAEVERLTKLLDTARGMLIYASGIPAAKHVFADEFMEDAAAFIRNRTAGSADEERK